MINVFFGMLLIFFRTNLNFVDIGGIYYVTNIIGYITLFFGIKELAINNVKFNKVQPYVIVMLCHSILFFILNISGNSTLTIELTSGFSTILSIVSLFFVIAGMFIIFYIINEILKVLSEDTNTIYKVKQLEPFYNAMLAFYLLAGVFSFISQVTTQVIISISLIIMILFLIKFYHVFLTRKESVA